MGGTPIGDRQISLRSKRIPRMNPNPPWHETLTIFIVAGDPSGTAATRTGLRVKATSRAPPGFLEQEGPAMAAAGVHLR